MLNEAKPELIHAYFLFFGCFSSIMQRATNKKVNVNISSNKY